MNSKLLKALCIGLAFLFCGLGIVGIVLPILPTTPFLLLASFFFAKGSTRFHNWFTSTGLYKKHLHSFVSTRAMTLRTKLTILLPASAMLIVAFIVAPIGHVRLLIGAVFLFKYYYFIFRIRTIKPEETESFQGESTLNED